MILVGKKQAKKKKIEDGECPPRADRYLTALVPNTLSQHVSLEQPQHMNYANSKASSQTHADSSSQRARDEARVRAESRARS